MPSLIERIWYGHSFLAQLLWPFSWVYRFVFAVRRWLIRRFFRQSHAVPVIVVGNLTVGGSGKTPLLIAIVQFLQQKGLQVGVVSRGYRSQVKKFPYQVDATSPVALSGDEPLLIAQKTLAPVVISPKRNEAIKYLTQRRVFDVILSDDGLQHDAMTADIEIVVVDGERGFGNEYCLPAGPLREPVSRLATCDFVVVNGVWKSLLEIPLRHPSYKIPPGPPLKKGGADLFEKWGVGSIYPMSLQPQHLIGLKTGQEYRLDILTEPVTAVAGIGNPARFFTCLQKLGIVFEPHGFPDHHVFSDHDLSCFQNKVVMTEKDAVKCKAFARSNWYCLSVEAQLPDEFWSALYARLKDCSKITLSESHDNE